MNHYWLTGPLNGVKFSRKTELIHEASPFCSLSFRNILVSVVSCGICNNSICHNGFVITYVPIATRLKRAVDVDDGSGG